MSVLIETQGPLAATASMLRRGPATSPVATLRWRVPGHAGDLALDADGVTPVLVPVPEHGASLAAAFVEALDRSARGRLARVEVRRGSADMYFERSDWPMPSRAPSEILAGQLVDAPAGAGNRRLAEMQRAIGDEGLQRLREFPARRRALATQRRRLERQFFGFDEQLRERRRNGALFLGLSAAGFAGATAGAVADAAGLAATGALLFALSAAGALLQVIARTRLEARREAVRESLAHLVNHQESLEDTANALARTLGHDDPLVAAEHVAMADAEPASTASRAEEAERRAIGRDLAALLGVPVSAVDRDELWAAPRACTSSSWPPDVARQEYAEGVPAAIVGMARLLQRVERDLPAPWPIVLWEPWSGALPDVRAKRLMAMARLAGGRPVIAFVRG